MHAQTHALSHITDSLTALTLMHAPTHACSHTFTLPHMHIHTHVHAHTCTLTHPAPPHPLHQLLLHQKLSKSVGISNRAPALDEVPALV